MAGEVAEIEVCPSTRRRRRQYCLLPSPSLFLLQAFRHAVVTFGGVEHCPDTAHASSERGSGSHVARSSFAAMSARAFHVEVPRFVPAVTGKAINEFGL